MKLLILNSGAIASGDTRGSWGDQITPDDEPYRYPGTIHNAYGIALVLPEYKIFTTYQGRYGPREAPDLRTTTVKRQSDAI
ncbi:hypothetical protein QUB80_04095 [Chlorogloeopsis sp. ULAP01]|uniref:hypothetical protein n=1 Tax=Chlorogloeopsis sp. ULAP01 TaxID=3056483 RepID=UPI0025AB3450|nr:hypothetical protein [Chlorogloeopsis sp. ULAP01]MDM9379879.1 hypothetical protein [Chlorogloeopsis sp. ULAP01]